MIGNIIGEINEVNIREEILKFDKYFWALLAAWWVWDDMKKRKEFFPTDIVAFCYPLVLPAYVFQTRGWGGFKIILFLFGVILVFGIIEISILDYLKK
ncbi:MAG: hypothetical protein MI748_08670 [Opitutales bacterium]|nr:hypothetical protein [Opitutales bacterium]